jgi:hypothetical protein
MRSLDGLPPPLPPGIAARVDITPETVDGAARNFATGQQDLISAYQKLSQRLQDLLSMAGNDNAAHQFAALYMPAGQADYQAFHTAIEALGGTSPGLTQTINNYLTADHHSRVGKPAGPPPRYFQHQVTTAFAVDASPPTVTGFNWAPSTTVPLLRIRIPHLPGWLQAIIGDSPDWPPGQRPHARRGRRRLAAGGPGDREGRLLAELGRSPPSSTADTAEYTAVGNYWATLYRPGDSTTVLS